MRNLMMLGFLTLGSVAGCSSSGNPQEITRDQAVPAAWPCLEREDAVDSFRKDGVHVTDGGENWIVWFRYDRNTSTKPQEAYVTVKKASGETRFIGGR